MSKLLFKIGDIIEFGGKVYTLTFQDDKIFFRNKKSNELLKIDNKIIYLRSHDGKATIKEIESLIGRFGYKWAYLGNEVEIILNDRRERMEILGRAVSLWFKNGEVNLNGCQFIAPNIDEEDLIEWYKTQIERR